jgi:hypothetical protein
VDRGAGTAPTDRKEATGLIGPSAASDRDAIDGWDPGLPFYCLIVSPSLHPTRQIIFLLVAARFVSTSR